MYAPQTRGTASLAAARMRSVAGPRVISFCNRDVRRMRLEDDFGRIRAESAGLTAHAVGTGARRKPREPEIERNEMVLVPIPPTGNHRSITRLPSAVQTHSRGHSSRIRSPAEPK